MIKKLYLSLMLICATARSSDFSMEKFNALDRNTQHSALTALAVDSANNFQTTLPTIAPAVARQNCKHALDLYFATRLKSNLTQAAQVNPFAGLLAMYNENNANFSRFFTESVIQSFAATINGAPTDTIKMKYASLACHILQLHRLARNIVTQAQKLSKESDAQPFSTWLSTTLHETPVTELGNDPVARPVVESLEEKTFRGINPLRHANHSGIDVFYVDSHEAAAALIASLSTL